MKRVLFIHNIAARFVQIDLGLLQERFTVREWYQRSRVVNLPALGSAVARCDLVFAWFASWHTFFPMLIACVFKRPSIIVVGGYDTASMPEIGYGSQRGGVKKWLANTTINLSTLVITNSLNARDELLANVGVSPERIRVIYHGLDPAPISTNRVKENLVVTVGSVNRSNLHRKGLEPFVRAARLVSDASFVVVGRYCDDALTYLRSFAPPNVRFTGWVSDEELCDYLARARVYVQASRHEAFGLAVAEAMLYECVPVVTRAGSLPEVVGEAGVVIESPDPASVADGVRRALTLQNGCRQRSRERIIGEFPLQQRRARLYAVIDEVIGSIDECVALSL